MAKVFYGTLVSLPEGCNVDEIPDLYSLIRPKKEQQYRDFGMMTNNNFEEKMLAVLQGKPQKRMLEDRLGREIVKAMLSYNQCGFPMWLRVQGKDPKYLHPESTIFPRIPDEIIETKIDELISDGLVEGVFYKMASPCFLGFESEIVYYLERIPDTDGKPAINNTARFVANKPLREALKKMLNPYSNESQIYKHMDKNTWIL
jgi:hypothetical protein